MPASTTTPRPARSALLGMTLKAPFQSHFDGPASSPETRESAWELRGYHRVSGMNLERSRVRKARELTAKFCMSREKGSRMPWGRPTMRHWPVELVARENSPV